MVGYEIALAIADREGVRPDELAFSIGEHVELDSLERLLGHPGSSIVIEFSVPGYLVTIGTEEDIVVEKIPGDG